MTDIHQYITLLEGLKNPSEIGDFSKSFNDPAIDTNVHTQAARKRPRWKSSLVKSMKKYGFKLIGAGINGAVFRNDEYPYVIKVYRNDEGYDEWLHFIRTHPQNKFVPVIKGRAMRLNQIFKAVRLEYLIPCPVEKANTFSDSVGTISDALTDKYRARFSGMQVSSEYEDVINQADQDIIDIANFLREWEDCGNAFNDLTAHNIMCRENGSIVILDPLYIDPTITDD